MTTPANLPYGTALSGSNAQSWAEAILSDLGAPDSAADIETLEDWFAREGGGGENNPLNTTLVTSGSIGSINSAGVQSYSTPAAGASADAQTIESGYPAILSALQSGSGFVGSTNSSISSELSEWSGGGYSSVNGTSTVSAPVTTDSSLNPFSVFQSLGDFFTDLTSADLWERGGLVMFGVMLIIIGLVILGTGPALAALGMTARTGRGIRSVSSSFGSSAGPGGPTEEEKADRNRRLNLAEENASIGRMKVETQAKREARLSRSNSEPVKGVEHTGGREPNPAPPHS